MIRLYRKRRMSNMTKASFLRRQLKKIKENERMSLQFGRTLLKIVFNAWSKK